jgi:hypothetical protein
VAVTKADLPEAAEVQKQLADTTGREVLLISGVTGEGLNRLVNAIAQTLREVKATPQARDVAADR